MFTFIYILVYLYYNKRTYLLMFRYVRHLYSSLFILQQKNTMPWQLQWEYLYSSLFILQQVPLMCWLFQGFSYLFCRLLFLFVIIFYNFFYLIILYFIFSRFYKLSFSHSFYSTSHRQILLLIKNYLFYLLLFFLKILYLAIFDFYF